MAVKLGGDEAETGEIADINVTPFIDVMLVLLIIFMVAAPLATVDIKVNLPAASAQPQPRPDKPIYLTVRSDLGLALGDDAVTMEALPAAMAARMGTDRDQPIYLRADKGVPYGEIMNVLNALRRGNFLKIALVGLDSSAAPPDPAPSRR